MKNRNQIELEDNFIEQSLPEAFGYGEEQLAQEMERMQEEAEDDSSRPPASELQKIMDRLDEKPAVGHKVIRMRKLVKVLVAAAVLGAMVIGGGMWVGAKRYYVQDVRDRADIENIAVFNNNEDNVSDDLELEEAYAHIKKELGIEVLELDYLPENMTFYELTITSKKSVIQFKNGINDLFFIQGLNDKPSSLSYVSDSKEIREIYNEFLEKTIPIYQEKLENEEIEFGIRITNGNAYYVLYGVLAEEEFDKIVRAIKVNGKEK